MYGLFCKNNNADWFLPVNSLVKQDTVKAMCYTHKLTSYYFRTKLAGVVVFKDHCTHKAPEFLSTITVGRPKPLATSPIVIGVYNG